MDDANEQNIPSQVQVPTQIPTITNSPSFSFIPSNFPSNRPTLSLKSRPNFLQMHLPWTLQRIRRIFQVTTHHLHQLNGKTKKNGDSFYKTYECDIVESIVNSQTNTNFDFCEFIEHGTWAGRNVKEARCVCGGGKWSSARGTVNTTVSIPSADKHSKSESILREDPAQSTLLLQVRVCLDWAPSAS